MSGDAFFEVRWSAVDERPGGGIGVRLGEETTGERVTDLTRAAREVGATLERRLRIDVSMRQSADVESRQIKDYLWGDDSLNPARFKRHLQQLIAGRPIHTFRVRTNVVSGADLVGRDNTINELLERLTEGSCHLRAPRRYGKTSLLRRLSEKLPSALRVDLGHVSSLPGLTAAILHEARSRPDANVALRSAEPLASLPPAGSSDDAFDEAVSEVMTRHRDAPLVLLIATLDGLARGEIILLLDEFSLFLRGLVKAGEEEARKQLAPLAELRRRTEAPLRWVVAGSTGLSSFIQFKGLQNELADLEPVEVEPLPDAVSGELVEELIYGANSRPTPEVIERIATHTGTGIPYFLHALVSELIDELSGDPTVDVDAVDRAYYARLLGSDGGDYFKPFRVGDRPYPEHLRAAARAMLDALARSPAPVTLEQLLALKAAEGKAPKEIVSLLTCLEEDFDLSRSEESWSFRCKVLADRLRRLDPHLVADG
jgi:hypothetical protein